MDQTPAGHRARFTAGLHELAPDTYAWLQPNGGWGESNAGLVAGRDAAVLIDTLWDIRLTAGMLAAVRKRISVPIATVVNTHSDGDHVWGNQLLAGAEFVSTRAAARIIREESPEQIVRFKALAGLLRHVARLPLPVLGRMKVPLLPSLPTRELGEYVGAMLDPFDFSGIFVTPPGREFDGELTMKVGGRELNLIEVGPAHTPGDLIVHVPDAGLCFAADILFVGVAPVMWAGPTANWIGALERILALGADIVVPGHGPVSGRAEVEILRDYLEWLDTAAHSRLSAGRSVLDTGARAARQPRVPGRAVGWLGRSRAHGDHPRHYRSPSSRRRRRRWGARACDPLRTGRCPGRRARSHRLTACRAPPPKPSSPDRYLAGLSCDLLGGMR
jgi:glyoxylase-like metal-dependent hydrolase (beta-lactamase superfamily II)